MFDLVISRLKLEEKREKRKKEKPHLLAIERIAPISNPSGGSFRMARSSSLVSRAT